MTDAELRGLIATARDLAARVGPQHAMWDIIGDAEAMLEGRRPIVDDRPLIERTLLRFVVARIARGRRSPVP